MLSALALSACLAPVDDGLDEPDDEASQLRSQALVEDTDGDGVPDANDNCPAMANAAQTNSNGIGPGDACELALSLGSSPSSTFAQYKTTKQLTFGIAPFTLSATPELFRITSGTGGSGYYRPANRRLGVRASSEWWTGQDSIAPGEQLGFDLGQAALAHGTGANLWLRLRGDGLLDGQLRVKFVRGATTVNEVLVTVPRNGSNTPVRVAASAPFNRVQITGVSRSNSIYGLSTRPESVLVELACTAGYRDANGSCDNIDECAESSDNCSPNAKCVDTSGSFYCYCQDGYVGDGVSCSLP